MSKQNHLHAGKFDMRSLRATRLSGLLMGLLLACPVSPVQAQEGDEAAGARAFKNLCGLCHTVEKDGRNKVGPNLHGIVGATPGRVQDYRYSKALKESGFIFTLEGLDTYLADYRGAIPGTKKSISGISDPKRRADIIAYLRVATGE